MNSSGEVCCSNCVIKRQQNKEIMGIRSADACLEVSHRFMMLMVVIGELKSHSSDARSGEEQRE